MTERVAAGDLLFAANPAAVASAENVRQDPWQHSLHPPPIPCELRAAVTKLARGSYPCYSRIKCIGVTYNY